MAEWQRITAVYRGMYDDELINLAADTEDLTDIARQVLNDELKRRGLGDIAKPGLVQTLPEPMRERRAALLGNQGGAPQLVLDHRANYDNHSGTIEYTWKTLLCECETLEKAQQLKDHLKLAGIDSWIDDPNLMSRFKGFENPRPRVLVAADQLEQARAVAERSNSQGGPGIGGGTPGRRLQDARVPRVRGERPGVGRSEPVQLLALRRLWQPMDGIRRWLDLHPLGRNLEGSQNGKSRPATGQLLPQGE